ncbi:anthranilate synthase component II [Butyrivibrio sp. WCE2006]|uniref:anthranilate synthase component II n=1 Tax=Butyrivibrio sp. WCE2006 TaxID=1410611 RepID=UPI0005D21731|nr:aminodeoxychorismate/anthranilate synthase component II [Butyrivibrio sp. WCE2006]
MILLVDNYDSFSYNLYQLIGEIITEKPGTDAVNEAAIKVDTSENEGKENDLVCKDASDVDIKKKDPSGAANREIKVIRNDELTVEEIEKLAPERIILSPGPGRPEDAGVCIDIVKKLGNKIPILGVCLGHQAICAAHGATVTYAKQLMHGKQSDTKLDTSCLLFKDCPEITPVARYHSLAADESTLPEELAVTASTTEGEVMAVKHIKHPIYGVQFHPESIMTPDGKKMLRNFIEALSA